VNFWTPISPKLIEVGIEIWYAGACVGQATASKTMVATADQLTIANANYVTVTEVAGTRGQLTPDKKLCCCKEAAQCFVSVSS